MAVPGRTDVGPAAGELEGFVDHLQILEYAGGGHVDDLAQLAKLGQVMQGLVGLKLTARCQVRGRLGERLQLGLDGLVDGRIGVPGELHLPHQRREQREDLRCFDSRWSFRGHRKVLAACG